MNSRPEDSAVPRLEISGSHAMITFRRPAEHNRIDPEDLAVLLDHFAHVIAEASVRALVITGTGDKTFSSGYTIEAIRATLDNRFEAMLDTLETLPLPVVCALNGSAYGGATDLALCCDFRIGVRGSRMFMPAAKFGLHYYPGGVRRFVTRLGVGAAKKLLLTGQAIDAEEMLRVGFLTELVDRDQLQPTIARYLGEIEECDPAAVASMKGHLNQVADGTVDLPAQRQAYEASLKSEELARRLDRRSLGKARSSERCRALVRKVC